MKLTLTFVLLIAFCSFSVAQEYAIGIKGGLNYYNIGDLNSRGGSIQAGKADETFTPNNEIGTQLGIFFNVAFEKLFIRTEINSVSNKNNYDFPIKTSQWRASKIDVPILVGYKVFDQISIYAGLSFSFFSQMTIEGANNTAGPSTIDFSKNTTSINFGILLGFKRYEIDLRYEYGLKETDGEFGNNYQDFHNSAFGTNITDIWSYRPTQISLSLNIFLFKTNGFKIGNIFKNKDCNCLR